MRLPFTAADAIASGMPRASLRRLTEAGRVQRVLHGAYLEGAEPPSALEIAAALVHVTGATASGTLAAALHGLDGVELAPPYGVLPYEKRGRSG